MAVIASMGRDDLRFLWMSLATVRHEVLDPAPTAVACPVCNNTHNNLAWRAREMMVGTRDEFEYVECGACGCLHLADPPADLGSYYPPEYYAHAEPRRESPVRRWLWRVRAGHTLGRPSVLGRVLVATFGSARFADWITRTGLSRDERVLDVGCGTGRVLRRMRAAGWRNLTGVDPLISGDVTWPDGVVLFKRTLADMTGQFDFIMSHHAFEHIPDPVSAATQMRRLLAPGGRVLIRIPVADSLAWRMYRTNWVQLDAPRHFFLHTRESMRHVADRSGLVIDEVTYDSTGYQFWASEQYQRDIALFEAIRQGASDGALCSRDEFRRCEARARALNATEGADSACFYMHAA
jgi:SAM-dependent methyltransferase